MSPAGPRVYLCEDDARFARALARALAARGVTVAGHAGSAEAMLDALAAAAPEVLLLDLELPGMGGLEALAAARARRPELEVLVLTTFADESRVFAAVRDGAAGYLLKRMGPDAIAAACREARAGGVVIEPRLARRFWTYLDGQRGRAAADPYGLSEAEREVLEIVGRGLTNPEAAGALGTTRRAVKAHLEAVYRKLGCRSRVEAVARALRAGLIRL